MCPIVEPDFSEKPPLAPGVYVAKILSCEQKFGKDKGTPYLGWKFETIAPDSGGWIFLNTTFSGKGAQFFKQLVKAAKYPSYESGPINTDDLLGCQVQLTCQQKAGSQYPEVLEIHPCEQNEADIPF